MAFKLLMTDGSLLLDFLSTAYKLRDGGLEISTPMKKQIWGGESVYSHGSQLVTSTFKNRRIRVWFQVTGLTRDELSQNVSNIERILENARQRSIEEQGARVELQYQYDGASGITYFELLDGELRWPKDTMSVQQVHQRDENGRFIIYDFQLTLECDPFAYSISPVNGTPIELSLTNGNGADVTGGLRVYNHDDATVGHDNWVEINGANISGDYPAKVKLILESEAGESEKTSKIYIGLRKGDLSFVNILEDTDATNPQAADVDSAIAEDGGSFTDETTEANNATSDDMTLLPAAPAQNDAYYFGYDLLFGEFDLNISTAGAGTWTITWEYWNGVWTALAGVSDGTSGFTVGGTNLISWTLPTDWAKRSIEALAVSAAISVTTNLGAQDETTEANNATTNDVQLFAVGPVVGDAFYFGHTNPFDKVTLNLGVTGVGTWAFVWEYWNGVNWTELGDVVDGTGAFKIGGTNEIEFSPPSNWVANSVNAQGPFYYIRARLSEFSSMSVRPWGTQAWINPEVAFFVRGRVSSFSSLTTQPLGQQVTMKNEVPDSNNSSGGTFTNVRFDAIDGEVDLFEWALTGAQVEATQGPFRFFGRTREGTHWDIAGSYSIVVKYQSSVLFQSEWRKPVDTITELLDLGTVYLPPWLVGTPTNLAGLTIVLRAKRDIGGSSSISFDYMALIPQDGGYRILEYRTTGTAQFEETVDDGWEDSVYHINTSGEKTGLPYGLMPRLELEPGVTARLYFLMEGIVKNCEISRQLDVQVFAVPTHNALV